MSLSLIIASLAALTLGHIADRCCRTRD